MCGRFTMTTEELEAASRFGTVRLQFTPRFNIAPTQSHPVLFVENGKAVSRDMRWGFLPPWSNQPIINAQSETAHTKRTFKTALEQRRCLVPADGFYEWKPGTPKQPMRIIVDDGRPFFIAGLWSRFKVAEEDGSDQTGEGQPSAHVECFTLLTRAANTVMAQIHSRMPVILVEPVHGDWWLDPAGSMVETVLGLPITGLHMYPVGTAVNNARHDRPDLIRRVDQPGGK